MIEIKKVSKKFGDFIALNEISFDVKDGEVLGFLGPNGAGKTTTMRIITGFLEPTSGEVYVDGRNIYENLIEVKKKMGYLPENNPLYQDLTVKENLEFFCEIKKVEDKVKEIKRVVQICGLTDVFYKPISYLSKGYKKRVGLAQALIGDPKILILDEPTEGLDPNQRMEIRNLIKEISKEKTILLSSHVLQEVSEVADRLVIINKGKIVACGTSQELQALFQGNIIINLELKGEIPEHLINSEIQKIEGFKKIQIISRDKNIRLKVYSSKDIREEIFRTCVRNNWTMLEISIYKIGLEDIFRELTK